MELLSSQYIVDIINQEMSMPPSTVWLRDQNRLFPNDTQLYIIVGIVSAITASNVTYMEDQGVDNIPEEHQINEVIQQENIQIDILSRSNAAITRNWEVIAAMQSFYSQQVQEKNNFKIFRIPRSFVNTPYAEGGSQLNRYTITIPCLVWYRKDKLLNSPLGDYYDDFTTRVDDENTIGTPAPLIEFEINSEGIVT